MNNQKITTNKPLFFCKLWCVVVVVIVVFDEGFAVR